MKIYDKPIMLLVWDEKKDEYIPVLKLHAAVNRVAESERIGGGAERDTVMLTFEVRYCKALEDISYNTQLYRLEYRGNTYNVTACDDYFEKHRTLKLTGARI